MSAELRRAALARAETMRSARVAEVLRRSQLLVRERDTWESSDGTVRAVDVHVLLDGFALGLVSAFPGVSDAVIEAVTAVAPPVLDASVVDLSFEWALREQSGADVYRDAISSRADRSSGDDVKRALAAFLAASGDEQTSQLVLAGALELRGERDVEVSVEPRLVSSALAALLGPVRVRRMRRDRS